MKSSFSLLPSWLFGMAITTLVVQVMTNPSRTASSAFTLPTTRATTTNSHFQRSQSHTKATVSSPPSSSTFLSASVEDDTEVPIGSSSLSPEIEDTLQNVMDGLYPDGELVTLVIKDHRPLGCTVEESLATPTKSDDESSKTKNIVKINDDDDDEVVSLDDAPAVFVSKVVEGGHAEQAGMEVGDVVIGVTGLFGNVMAVSGFDIERVYV